MKIIFNRKLRSIKNFLNKKGYKVPDFVWKKELLSLERDINKFVIMISNNNISEEFYLFALDLYKNDKKEVIPSLQDKELAIKLKKIYYEDNSLFSKMYDVASKNYFNFLSVIDIYEFIEKELFMKINSDTIAKISKNKYELIKKYLIKIEQNPDCLDYILNASEYEIEKVSHLLAKKNFSEIMSLYKQLKNENIKNILLENPSDEVLNFVRNILSNEKFKEEVISILNCNSSSLVERLIKCNDLKLSDDIKRMLLVYRIRGCGEESELYFKYLFDSQDIFMFTLSDTIAEASKYGYPISESAKKIVDICRDFSSCTSKGELSQKFLTFNNTNAVKQHYKNSVKWVYEFRRQQLTNGLFDPRQKEGTMKPCSYKNENGEIINSEVRIIDFDDLEFKMLYHVVLSKTKGSSPDNYELSQKLFMHPELYSSYIHDGNPNISATLGINIFPAFGHSSVLLGFSSLEENRLKAWSSCDAATPMDPETESHFSDLREKHIGFSPYEGTFNQCGPYSLKKRFNSLDYNEILLRRYIDEKAITPNYLIVFKTSNSFMIDETTYRWADYFNIPIIVVDTMKILMKHKSNYEKMLKEVQESDVLDESKVNELLTSLWFIKWYSTYNHDTDKTHLYDVFLQIIKNKDLSILENASVAKKIIEDSAYKSQAGTSPFYLAKNAGESEDYLKEIYSVCTNTIDENKNQMHL